MRNQGEDWVRVSRTSQGRMKEIVSMFVQAPLRGDAVCDEKENFAQPLSGAHGLSVALAPRRKALSCQVPAGWAQAE